MEDEQREREGERENPKQAPHGRVEQVYLFILREREREREREWGGRETEGERIPSRLHMAVQSTR